MENFKKLKDDAKLVAETINETRKVYSDTNKLRKQGASLSANTSVFICNNGFKGEFLCTYIHALDGAVDELDFVELEDMVNPNIYRNGVIVLSRNDRKSCFGDYSCMNESVGPMNSTALDEHPTQNGIDPIDPSNKIHDSNLVYCGNCELFAKDVNAGGASTFHGSLGHIKKVTISLNDFTPVPCIDSRYFSSVYIQCLKHLNIKDAPPLIVCCEPKQPMNVCKTVLFPEFSADGEHKLHIVTVFKDEEKEINKKTKEETVGLSSFLSTYDLFKTANNEKVDGETSLRVEFHWSGSDYEPMQPPPRSAKSVIQLQVAIGESRSAANEVYEELKRLDVLSHSHINTTAQHNLFNTTTCSDNIVKDLEKFKASVSEMQFYDSGDQAASSAEKTDDMEAPLSQLLMESFCHKDIDFTDKLWTFIQDSEHLESIRYILDDVLTDIVKGVLQPAISPSNETRLAKYIRKLYVSFGDEEKTDIDEKIMELYSSEQSMINLIREIGFEKLRKDYFHFFLSRELASLSDMERLCKPTNINISSLWKLHYCLEIVITPTIYLNLTPDCQCTLLKAAIDYYSQNEADGISPLFCLSLLPFHESSSAIQDLCQDRQPVIWQHGVIRANKACLDEASVCRIETKTVYDEDSTEAITLCEVKRFLREETLFLPKVRK